LSTAGGGGLPTTSDCFSDWNTSDASLTLQSDAS
jgi:hypothetical protein